MSLARTAGVTGELSNSRSRKVSAWLELADISMMSTRPDRVISRIWSRYSSSVLKRTSPACISGERPAAPRPRAMSASLASAMMNSRQLGSAWIAASLRSSDFSMMSAPPVPLSGDGDARAARRRRCRRPTHRHPDGTTRPSRQLGGRWPVPPGLALPAALGLLL